MSWLNAGINSGVPSRGSYDDDSFDDEELAERSYCLTSNFSEYHGTLQLLIITSTDLAKHFVDVYIAPKCADDGNVEIGQITEKEQLANNAPNSLEPKNIHERKVAKFYRISDTVLHCNVKEIPADDLNNFSDVLFGSEISKLSKDIKVAVLSSDHLTNFQSVDFNTLDAPLTRCLVLSPSKNQISPPCKRLEQPNVIKGVPASVLTECKFKEIPCLHLINYVDTQSPDSITLSGFIPLFNVSEFSQIKKCPNNTSNERLKRLYNKPNKTENIFM